MGNHIFISYSKKDSEFAIKLSSDLMATGHKVWIDRALKVGQEWEQTIEKNLTEANEVIVILSNNAINSRWVQHEGSIAYGLRKPIFPVLIEKLSVEQLPIWAVKFQYHDFTGKDYQRAFETLNAVLTPPNPIQDLLDQRVIAYQRMGELLGEKTLQVIEKDQNTLNISAEAKELLQRSTQAIEMRQRQDNEQKLALQDSKTKQNKIQKRSRAVIFGLTGLFTLAVLFAILSISPVSTGWQKLGSFNTFMGTDKTSSSLFITMNVSDPDIVFVSDHTPGGLYKSTSSDKCWSRIDKAPIKDSVVTGIAAGEKMVYLITSDGLFSSNDEGNSWKSLQLPPVQGELRPTVLAINPVNPLNIYVGIVPMGLFMTENGGKEWHIVNIQKITDSRIQALAHDGNNLVLATEKSVFIRNDNTKTWKTILNEISPIYSLSMVGNQGRFFIAKGEEGIIDADINSDKWRPLADSPHSDFIQSISANNAVRYAADKHGLWYWRLWSWTNLNWWRVRLNIPIPCH